MPYSMYAKEQIKSREQGDQFTQDELDVMTNLVKNEINNAEGYLDDVIRPNIAENWDYYNRKLPKAVEGISFVDNTCQATVDHLIAASMDAFTDGDSLEIIPEGVTNSVVLRVINSVVNDVLDFENNRHTLYRAFFQDSYVSNNGIMKPYVVEEAKIDKERFDGITEDQLMIIVAQFETNPKYEEVDYEVTEEVTEEIEQEMPPMFGMSGIIAQSITKLSGIITLKYTEKTIKIDNVPPENFIINKDAKSIESARTVGHKSTATISDLILLGFDEELVLEVAQRDKDCDDTNLATTARRVNVVGYGDDEESADDSQREVELYELFIRSSVMETLNEENKIAVSRLYQVFYSNGILLDCQEVDNVPYVGASPNPLANSFWGESLVDRTKHIQRAKTGAVRQIFQYNQLQTNPRFQYKDGVDTRSLLNPRAGIGVKVPNIGDVAPLQLGAMATSTGDVLSILEGQRESGTGVTFTGQGMLGDVLKAGGSTISGQMVLSEQQMMQKAVIRTMLEVGIKPLIRSIYNMLRENFTVWDIAIDNETMTINPSAEWPKLRDIIIRTPLGQNAKLEKAGVYMALANQLAMGQGEASKLMDIVAYRNLVKKSYELQGLQDAEEYLASTEEIAKKDELAMQMQQMQQQLMQVSQQMQQLTAQNQQLQAAANEVVQKDLQLREREVVIKEAKAEADMAHMADKQVLEEQKVEIDGTYKADQMSLKERMFEAEKADPESNVFSTI